MSSTPYYTTQLQAGLGLIEETKLLLSLYEPGQSATSLYDKALDSGMFPNVSARRLRNIVVECFNPRYIKTGSASYLQTLQGRAGSSVMSQLFLYYTATANLILADFIRNVYWARYAGGGQTVSLEDSRQFVEQAVRDGKTQKLWSDTTIKRISSYLVGCCADYGLLSSRRTSERSIQPLRIEQATVLYLAYKLHFDGLGDNAVIGHTAWAMFGLEPSDVRAEFKRLSLNNWLIVQAAGDVTRISWPLKSMEDVVDAIAEC
ncbi:BrxA family protein [Marinobacterium sp. YM272]|uniref:BrxA family protein n=1 Tax=Marinobacterium sp. YM272 TaxID=3421654 RepID=UPI003D7F3A55